MGASAPGFSGSGDRPSWASWHATRGKGYYKVEVAGDSRVFLNSFQLDASGGTDITKIGQYDLPKLYQPGDTFRLELRLLGDRLTVLVDGAVAIEAQDSHHAGPGNWGPTAGEGWFESAEVQTPLPAIAAAERWRIRFRRQALIASVMAKFGATLDGPALTLPPPGVVLPGRKYRDGAVRLRAIFTGKGGCALSVRERSSKERYSARLENGQTVLLYLLHEATTTPLRSIALAQPLAVGREYQVELRIVGSAPGTSELPLGAAGAAAGARGEIPGLTAPGAGRACSTGPGRGGSRRLRDTSIAGRG